MSEKLSVIDKVTVFTDGGCSGNPGPGGYAVYSEYTLPSGLVLKQMISSYEKITTNNERELGAFVYALKLISDIEKNPTMDISDAVVSITSDSTYCVNAFTQGWLVNWKKNGFKRKGKDIPNRKLWELAHQLYYGDIKGKVNIHWVRGHQEKYSGNGICDYYAVKAYKDKEGIKLNGDAIIDNMP